MEIQIKNITPAAARAMLLASNTKNRYLNNTAISVYKSDMKSGRWIENGQTITISESGDIIDGHHRLHALQDCEGVSITVPVVKVSDASAIETIDVGRPRTIPDLFEMKLNRNGILGNMTMSLVKSIRGNYLHNLRTRKEKFETLREFYFAYESGLNWAFSNGWKSSPEVGPRKKIKDTFKPGAKAALMLWSALGGIYSCNRELAEYIASDLSCSSENKTELGLAFNRTMLHHIDRPSDRKQTIWYEDRYVVGLNHYITGTSVTFLRRQFDKSAPKLRLDLIGQNWDVSNA
jgi:hypothetical protein